MAHKPIRFRLYGLVAMADGGVLMTIPQPKGAERTVTVTNYETDLPREARLLATEGRAAILSQAETTKDAVKGIHIRASVEKGQIAPRGFNAWNTGRQPDMRFALAEIEAVPA